MKVLIAGDDGVGKTSFVDRLNSGNFMTVNDIVITCVKYEEVKIEITYSCDVYHNGEGYDAMIVMFDLTRPDTYPVMDVRRYVPTLFLGNKFDLPREIQPEEITLAPYFDISVKSQFQFSKPWEWLVEKSKDQKKGLFARLKFW